MSSRSPGSSDQKNNNFAGFTVPSGVSIPNSQSSVLEEEIVEVKFSFSSERFQRIIAHYYSLIEEVALFEFKQEECDITRDEFIKYVNTLLHSRIAYVRSKANLTSVKVVVGPTNPIILIPDLVKCLLNHIGIVRDDEQGLIYHPTLVLEKGTNVEDFILSSSAMEKVAAKLRKYQRNGVTMWTEYTRLTEGDVDFMGFAIIKDKVMHHLPQKSFTKALLASALDVTGIELIVRPRHFYGDVKKMDLYLASLIQRKIA